MNAEWLERKWRLFNSQQIQDYLHCGGHHVFAMWERLDMADVENIASEHMHLVQKMIEERATNKGIKGPHDLSLQILTKHLSQTLLTTRVIAHEITHPTDASTPGKKRKTEEGSIPLCVPSIPGVQLPEDVLLKQVEGTARTAALKIDKRVNKFVGSSNLFEDRQNFEKKGKSLELRIN